MSDQTADSQPAATAEYLLGCGCTADSRPGWARVAELRNVGETFPCSDHGETVIMRATFRLGLVQDGGES